MTLGAALQAEFAVLAASKRREVDLFRSFIDAFNSMGIEAISTEYHGSKYQVTFPQSRGAGRPVPRCELCDVVIIQYPTNAAQKARITFNQMKVTNKTFSHCARNRKSAFSYSFAANLEQWDLLAHRPLIKSAVSTFNPASDLLSNATLPSVGSFGVFYPRAGTYDFAYFIAEELNPLTNNKSRSGTLRMTKKMIERRHSSGYYEVTGSCCFFKFGDALERGLVGSPLQLMLNPAAGDGGEMKAWLSTLLSELRATNPDSNIPQELASGLELEIDEGLADRGHVSNTASIRAVIAIRTNG